MVVKIEVYVRNEEVTTGHSIVGRPMSDGVTTHWCTAKETLKTEKVVREADRTALEIAREVAKENRLNVEVYDISSLSGKLRAKLRGVKTTPTLIIGNQKIEGESTAESLKNTLKSYLEKISV